MRLVYYGVIVSCFQSFGIISENEGLRYIHC